MIKPSFCVPKIVFFFFVHFLPIFCNKKCRFLSWGVEFNFSIWWESHSVLILLVIKLFCSWNAWKKVKPTQKNGGPSELEAWLPIWATTAFLAFKDTVVCVKKTADILINYCSNIKAKVYVGKTYTEKKLINFKRQWVQI